MSLNILVFPCGSEIGLEVYRSLKYEKNITLFGGSSVESDPGRLLYENYYNDFPYIDDPKFITYLNKFVKKHKIDIVYPAMDPFILKLSKHANNLECPVLLHPIETIEICMSKLKSYHHFNKKICTPKIYNEVTKDDFPLFSKPDFGHGSKGARLVKNIQEFEYLKRKYDNLIFIEYLPGKEYTVDCFTNHKGDLIFVGARERARIVNGISGSAYPIQSEKFNRIAQVINQHLHFNGAWFFQVKEDVHGELCLMEIAPRIAGVSGLYRNMGVNLPLLNIYNFMGVEVEVLQNSFYLELEKSFVSKYRIEYDYKKVYIDLDDTIIIKNKLNLDAIKFIYQCLNNQCKVILITRHRKDVYQTLESFKIERLFDEIIWITDDTPKSKYIDPNKSIFIDDSFKERKDVKEKLNVPVFAVDAIESLLN